jgi:hypothetical protein
VILTKDNLLKRNWKGNDKCCFCNNKETIQHLFFEWHVACFIWRFVHIAFGLQPPRDITSFFQTWLQQVDSKLGHQIRVGASIIFCSIWLTKNDVIFDKKCFTPIYRLLLGRLTGCGSGPHFKRRPTNQIWKGRAEWWRLYEWKFSPRMDGCCLTGLELNLFIQSPILLKFFMSFSTSVCGWNVVIMNGWVQNSCRGQNKNSIIQKRSKQAINKPAND